MNKAIDLFPNDLERAAYELLPCGVIWTEDNQRITFVNKLLRQLLGYGSEQLIGERRFCDLLSIGGKIYFETHFIPALALDGAIRETNFEMVDKSGIRHPVIVNVSRSTTAKGGYVYVVLPSRDRKEYERELKRARLKAEAADKAKSTFISTISHEIRTPLHAILEAGNFLFKDAPRPDQLEFIHVLRGAGNSLLSIVNDILDISKLEAGMTTLDERPVSADQLVKQVVDTYRPACREKGVTLRSVLPTVTVPLLMADAGKLIQVLNNLVSNAVKFTCAGEIVITLDHAEGNNLHQLHFRVRDTGTGIPAERLDQIFEPFVQADETTHAEYGGTGLGLSICKKILQACGSNLEVESKPGVGSEFYFTLNLKAASAAQRQQDQQSGIPANELPPLNHLRVLNVDDNRSNLLINARYFSEWKLSFDQVSSGREALEHLERNGYDLVLLDLRMPEMNGYELACAIRSHPDSAVNTLPLIALSASGSKDVNDQMLEAGIDGLVVKPFEPAYLHHIIRKYGEQGEQGHPEPQPCKHLTATGATDFTEVKDLFAADEAEYHAFLRIIKNDVVDARQVLSACTTTFSKKEFNNLKHNLISTMRVFRLDDLATSFEEGKNALEEENRDQFLVVIDRLLNGLEAFEAEVLRVLESG